MAIKNNLSDREERIAMVKAMEYIARQVNDEDIFDVWLRLGVADGDIPYADLQYKDVNEEDPAYIYMDDDEYFADLMATFLRLMNRARLSGGLYCGGVVCDAKDHNETPFAHVRWNNDDLREALKASDIPATDDNVWKLRNELDYGRHRLTDDMISTGWETIQNAIMFLRREKELKE